MKRRVPAIVLGLVAFGCLGAMAMQVGGGAPGAPPATGSGTTDTKTFQLWDPIRGTDFQWYEKVLLVLNVFVALGGLGYALMLVKQVREADEGTPKMQEIALAVREGANAYLYRQFRVVGVLIVVITVLLYLAAALHGNRGSHRLGPRHRVFGRLDLLGHGRLCRHATGHDRQLARGRRGSAPASARHCSWVIARAPSPAC